MKIVSDYLAELRAKYATGQATEHSYRPALEKLFRAIDPTLTVINEPKRVEVGAPDFLLARKDVNVGWVEAKDVGRNLRQLKGHSAEQKVRYLRGFANLVYTNGLDFEFYRDGKKISEVSIADVGPGLPSHPDSFETLARNLQSFMQVTPISIRSAARLAKLMAGKAAIIKDVINNVLTDDVDMKSAIAGQYKAFKADLLPDLRPSEFADIYAETITYGLFAARLHDPNLNTFSRAEALELLPRSNPFLRSLFAYIAGPTLEDRIRWIIDDLAAILRTSDPALLFKDFGKFTARNDPFVHFYEDFLKEYNPQKRKSRGVWYTPEPVVDFIVRAVEETLVHDFKLTSGLADTSKITIDYDTGTHDRKGKPITTRKEVHRVQILDPATGTGTFLARAIHSIFDRVRERAPGKWRGYVEKELIPRMHGFELLMASYAMGHMKIDMMLRETGYQPSEMPPRLSVWLTNALEEGEREVRDLFFTALADEARGANDVKRNMPIMCVIGNPPYSGHSSNKGEWIENLMKAYKTSPALKKPAQAKWLSDDYVKFIRISEHLIAKNMGGGILGFITNHGYLDNPTFMDMRKHLMSTFSKIVILDLHGNTKKKERAPNNLENENVFDIQQGVAIIIAARIENARADCEVYHRDIWGTRTEKYDWLQTNSLATAGAELINPVAPYWRWKPSDPNLLADYEAGFSVAELFGLNGRPAPGIVTTHDEFAISWSRQEAEQKVQCLLQASSEEDARRLFRLCTTDQWDYGVAVRELGQRQWRGRVGAIAYRPFDTRYTVYDENVAVHRRERVMNHYWGHSNLGLLTTKAMRDSEFAHAFVTSTISEAIFLSGATASNAMNLPLYLYSGDAKQRDAFGEGLRKVNLDRRLYTKICAAAGIEAGAPLVSLKVDFAALVGEERPTEVKVFDYVYGILHSAEYRTKFNELLKIEFPRIPYPRGAEMFKEISAEGEKLRRLHLMQWEPEAGYEFCGEGDDVVAAGYPKHEKSRAYINPSQHFENVTAEVWSWKIGGYKPAEKWLKDRRGRTLSWADISSYQRIVYALKETSRIAQGIIVTTR